MELKQIKLSDIVPDENNPRKDFGDLHALARTFEANTYAPGQPYNAIVVVTDGEMYRIADGERRFRAMQLNDTEECNAVICGDYEEADSIIAMLASDAKAPLTETERATAVQRALLLGVPAKTVEDIGRLKKGQAKKIKAFVDNGMAAQATIDQILEAYELREKGADADAVQSVLDAGEEDWSTIASDVRRRMKADAFRERVGALLSDAGHILDDERPTDMVYHGMHNTEESLSKALKAGELPENAHFWINAYPLAVYVYGDAAEDDGPVANERVDRAAIAIKEGVRARASWYAGKLLETDRQGHRIAQTPRIDALLCARAADGNSARRFRETAGSEPPRKQPAVLSGSCAETLYALCATDLATHSAELLADEDAEMLDRRYWGPRIEWLDAFVADGFEMSAEEAEVIGVIRERLEPAEDADGETPAEPASTSTVVPEAATPAAEVSIPMMTEPAEAEKPATDNGELDVASLIFDGKVA